jgi:multisubunit Na+/H+ antiporter MnhB subunit
MYAPSFSQGSKGSANAPEPADASVLFDSVTDGLKHLYRQKIRPVEELYKFGEFYQPLMSDHDFDAKPMILLLGVYVFVNGHLTPGGGFQGGAIVASGVLLMLLADPLRHFSHGLISAIESLAGLFYVAIGLAGLFLAGGFLDNRILPLGNLGELFSAGAIPVIYSLIGLKVGAEFSSMLASLSETEEL